MSKQLGLACALVLLLALGACKGGGEGGGKSRGKDIKYPVETEEVIGRHVEYTIAGVGSLEAYEEVHITSRVSGIVDKVLFVEGDIADASKVLVEIDAKRFTIARDIANAARIKAAAEAKDAKDILDRRKDAVKKTPGIYSPEDLATLETKLAIANAEADRTASVHKQALLDLEDASVKPPFAGVIQSRTVRTGQQVQPGTVLATLLRKDPLLLRFSVPEQDAAHLKDGMEANFSVRDDPVTRKAKITLVAAQADSKTRMVEVVGRVQGDTASLRPGAFAQVSVPIATNENAPSVPQTAVRPSDRGFLAFVVEGEKAVERVLRLGLRTADGRVEVLEGISLGERVVIRGAEALSDGAGVREGRVGEGVK